MHSAADRRRHLPLRRRLPWLPAIAASALVSALASGPAAQQQSALSKGASAGIPVVFELRTSSDRVGGATDDQLTIVFSSVSAAQQRTPPSPLFGEDTLAEFSFSGRDARPGSTLTFKRVVSSADFLNARFLRIINHGSDGWAGESLSLTVGGRRILDGVSLYPRKGSLPGGAIEKFNARQWYERNYWEVDLQRARGDRLSAR